jgi:predicted  nucleic acid-binding Zn-ribbon protein
MSSRSVGMAGSVVSLEPKANVRSEASDQLDKAGQAILGLLNRAATAAETNYQQAIEMTHKLSAQLRSAEDRIRELEAHVRHHQERADRAERWLYQISVEIEQKFFGREEARSSRPPSPQA